MDSMEDISDNEWERQLFSCCASVEWVREMLEARPFADEEILIEQAETLWFNLSEDDWLEAFAGHAKIGDFATDEGIAGEDADPYGALRIGAQEQARVRQASQETLSELATYNKLYREKYGFIFIVCASGKSAGEILQLLKQRLHNDRLVELQNAAVEQNEIIKLRLEKLL